MKIVKPLAYITILFLLVSLHAQSDEVTLTVMGQGKTVEEAQQQAFRDAIMQTYGVFISSNTEVANEKLKADSVKIITNGSVKRFEVVSKQDNPDGTKAVMLKVVVSTQNLGAFFEGASGSTAKISGGLIAFKFKQQKLNELNEVDSIKNMVEVLKSILDRSFDYSATIAAEPYASSQSSDEYIIPVKINFVFNKNILLFVEYFEKTIKAIQLNKDEADSLIRSNKTVYLMQCDARRVNIYLRSGSSLEMITRLLFEYLPDRKFEIKDNLGESIFKLGTKNYATYEKFGNLAKNLFNRDLKEMNRGVKFDDAVVQILDAYPNRADFADLAFLGYKGAYFTILQKNDFDSGGPNDTRAGGRRTLYSKENERPLLFSFTRTFKPSVTAFSTTIAIAVNQNKLEKLTELKAIGIGSDLNNNINIDILPDREATAAKPAESAVNPKPASKILRFPETKYPAWQIELPQGWAVVPGNPDSLRVMNQAKTGSIDLYYDDMVSSENLKNKMDAFLKGAGFDSGKRQKVIISGFNGFKYSKTAKSPEGVELNMDLVVIIIDNRYALCQIIYTMPNQSDAYEIIKAAETMRLSRGNS